MDINKNNFIVDDKGIGSLEATLVGIKERVALVVSDRDGNQTFIMARDQIPLVSYGVYGDGMTSVDGIPGFQKIYALLAPKMAIQIPPEWRNVWGGFGGKVL